ncbi:MAG TPA: histidinol phosphatase [Lacibacter sp.]|nr:histidinol phosphatase [Lacibacter sp.]
MFGLFRRKEKISFSGDLSILGTDMHSHLLPGIDDGAPDAETAAFLVRGMMELGYQRFITTPHIYPDLYPNNRETITRAHAVLQEELQRQQLDVNIIPAAEYFIDDLFPELLEKGEPLLTLGQNRLLVEISFISPPRELNHILFDLVTGGYHPVLAHPERYAYYHHQRDVYHRFKDQGCLLQINILSLTGYYGKSVQEAARYLVQEGLVDFIGSDLHHERHLATLQSKSLHAEVHAIAARGTLLNTTL